MVFVSSACSCVAEGCISHVDVVLSHGVGGAGQPVVREVGRGDLFGGGQWGCCPTQGVTKGGEATVCEVVYGELFVSDDGEVALDLISEFLFSRLPVASRR